MSKIYHAAAAGLLAKEQTGSKDMPNSIYLAVTPTKTPNDKTTVAPSNTPTKSPMDAPNKSPTVAPNKAHDDDADDDADDVHEAADDSDDADDDHDEHGWMNACHES